MSSATYFVQDCPTCGRKLEIRVEYLGRSVVCQHCHGRFRAAEEPTAPDETSTSWLMRRADELLEMAARREAVPG